MVFINTLREGDMVSSIYLCKVKNEAQTKAGKNYYSLQLQDSTGVLDGKIWDLNNGIGHFEAMDYIHVDGQVVCFQGGLQLNIKRVRKAQEGEYTVEDYMPCSQYDRTDMYRQLLKLISSVEDADYKALLEYFFKDPDFSVRFRDHSAAKSVHHGFIGGLLQHTIAVAKLCDFYAAQYSMLNRDLLVTAALFHDIGKVDELSDFPENDYTDEGQLVGHIVMGAIMLDRAICKMEAFPARKANELKHCILSHHGKLEFGSPKKPALMEALALSYADDTDAKMETMTELLENSMEQSDWLGYNRLLESNVRRSTK